MNMNPDDDVDPDFVRMPTIQIFMEMKKMF